MVALGASTLLVSSCGVIQNSDSVATVYGELEKIIRAKQELISDAKWLLVAEPALSGPLQVVVDQSLIHVDALASYLPAGASPSPSSVVSESVDLTALAARCKVFSANSLQVASNSPDAEISRVVALIAGSEIQHHAMLIGYII